MPKPTIKEWLRIPCKEEETLQLSSGARYMPIDIVRGKLRFLEDTYLAKINYSKLVITPHTDSSKETRYSGTIHIEITADGFSKSLVGGATFGIKEYGENCHYAAICKSLATVNALSTEYEAFGKDLNKEFIEPQVVVKTPVQNNHSIDEEFKTVEEKLSSYEFREEAQEYLESTSFRHFIKAKQIVNNKPLKSN